MGVVIDPETNLFLKEIKERGRKEGLKEGEIRAIKRSVQKLYLKKGLSIEEIAEILEISVNLVRKAIKEMEGKE
jgi:predicted transposase/invertase (TIGR01784 family)